MNNENINKEDISDGNKQLAKTEDKTKSVGQSIVEVKEVYSKRFEIIKLDAIALWTWNVKVDNCSICRNHIMALCIECQARNHIEGDEECPISWGICNHAFHYHCISRWTQSRPVCPLDNSEWKFAKLGN